MNRRGPVARPMTALGAERKLMFKARSFRFCPLAALPQRPSNGEVGWIFARGESQLTVKEPHSARFPACAQPS